MNKPKIGIFCFTKKYGGVYQYFLSLINSLSIGQGYDSLIFYNNPEEKFKKIKAIFVNSKENSFLRLFRKLVTLLNFRFYWGGFKVIKDFDLDLFIFPYPTLDSCYLKVPYIVAIHDLMHKYYPFYSRLKRLINYDVPFFMSAKHSVFVVVDSERGKEDLMHFYKIPEEKIKIIPFLPPPYIYEYKDINQQVINRLLLKYNLPTDFIFYPAQFWPIKNHLRLIKALHLIQECFKIEIPVVFVGSPFVAFKKVISMVNKLKLKDQVHYLGYVSNEEIIALYKRSRALVFPSLAGPTNIPILEAFVLGVPVVCSNLFSMPEQVGDAGILFDPFDIEDMAEKIHKVWVNEGLRRELTRKGYERVKDLTPKNYAKKWEEVIKEALEKIGK